jgi:tRNA pseudouridine13 synthase
LLHIEKRLHSTQEAIAVLAGALEVDPRAAGFAGMKDRVAVARQWISLPGVDPQRAMGLDASGGVRVLEAARHPRRLRTGQLRGNRFTIRLRGVADITQALADLARDGLENRFGPQRFAGDNVSRGRALVLGRAPAGRDRLERRLLVSALQASVFNDYLDLRPGPLEGEPLRRGMPTGPVPGYRMPRAREGTPARALEDEVLGRAGVTLEDFRRVRRLGRGTRRALRTEITDASCEPMPEGDGIVVRFTLPAGCYATEVIDQLLLRAPGAG